MSEAIHFFVLLVRWIRYIYLHHQHQCPTLQMFVSNIPINTFLTPFYLGQGCFDFSLPALLLFLSVFSLVYSYLPVHALVQVACSNYLQLPLTQISSLHSRLKFSPLYIPAPSVTRCQVCSICLDHLCLKLCILL